MIYIKIYRKMAYLFVESVLLKKKSDLTEISFLAKKY